MLLGAHCDDIAIGAGAALLDLCAINPGLEVHALVMTGGGTERAAEERAALADFCPGARLSVTVADLPDAQLPAHWGRAKDTLAGFRDGVDGPVDLVLAPQPADAHQDHRLLAEQAGQVFRDQLIWHYEILKAESDLPAVNAYLAASPALTQEKISLLHKHYRSQLDRTWFDAEAFAALMRVRGAQCGQRYAEGFVVCRFTVAFGS